MTAEELLMEIREYINCGCEGITAHSTKFIKVEPIIKLLNSWKSDIEKNAYPNTFAKDGETEFCGKCGTAI